MDVVYEAPASDTEKLVAATVGEVLGRGKVGRHDDFFALGGDSLRAFQVMTRLQRGLGLELSEDLLFDLPTPALLGARLDELAARREIEALSEALAKLTPAERARVLEAAPPSTQEGENRSTNPTRPPGP
jgi:acyl carrier protein